MLSLGTLLRIYTYIKDFYTMLKIKIFKPFFKLLVLGRYLGSGVEFTDSSQHEDVSSFSISDVSKTAL